MNRGTNLEKLIFLYIKKDMTRSVEFTHGEMKYGFQLSIEKLLITAYYSNGDNDVLWECYLIPRWKNSELSLWRIFEIARSVSLGRTNDEEFKIDFPKFVSSDTKSFQISMAYSMDGYNYCGERFQLDKVDLKTRREYEKKEKAEKRTKLVSTIANLVKQVMEMDVPL
jgi:hypothetical protein